MQEQEAGKLKIKAELGQTAVTLSYECGVKVSQTREVRQPLPLQSAAVQGQKSTASAALLQRNNDKGAPH